MYLRLAVAFLSAALLLSGECQAQRAAHSGHASMSHGAVRSYSRPAMSGHFAGAATGHFVNRPAFRSSHGSFGNCYYNANCRYRSFYPAYGYAYPVYGYGGYSDVSADVTPQEPAYDDSAAQANAQLDRLNYEVDQLRADQESSRQNQHQENAPKDLGTITPTVLVFPDGHRMQINNYAVVGKTVWVMSDHAATQKIQISQLDLPATVKANEENGIDFSVP